MCRAELKDVRESEVYRAWRKTLIEVLGEDATTLIEQRVNEKLGQKRSELRTNIHDRKI